MMKKRKHKVKRARRRRHNPVPVLFANPHRRRRRKRPTKRRAHARRRRPSTALALRRHSAIAPRRRHRRRRHSTGLRHRRFRRRHNPSRVSTSGLKVLLGVGLFGGLGIVTARIGGMLYRDHVSKMVLGDKPDTTRQMISDVLRLASMGLVTIGVSKGLAKVKVVSPAHQLAFKVGGLAETGRQAVGLAIGKFAPSYTKYGLDGYRAMHGLESRDSFMGYIEDADSFNGCGDEEEDLTQHPFANLY